jgi:hypothetical protein
MITRLLRKFCSPEVEMMLKHLEEHPEDFRSRNFSTNRTNMWELLADNVERSGTFVEQTVLKKVKEKAFKKADRQILLGRIVAQTVAPETVSQEEIEDDTAMLSRQYGQSLAQSMLNTKAFIGAGIGNPTQLAHQQHIAAHQQALRNQYQNIATQAQGLTGITSTSTATSYQSP